MSKAEERALEFYPMKDYNKERNYIHSCDSKMLDEVYRQVFMLGYEQAEKDLAPLIEAATVVYEAWNGGTMDDVRGGMAELGKQFKEGKK